MSFYKCKSKICRLKSNFIPKDEVVSTSRKRIYYFVLPNGITTVDFNSANVIYLITFNKCSLQYLRETVQSLNKRLN